MDKAVLEPVLRKHKLIAFVTNMGWVLIRRCDYIDVFIKNQPFNSVQVLFETSTRRIIIRMWGCTLLDTQETDLAKEVDRAFSTKPCFGMRQIFATIQQAGKDKELVKKCLVWTKDKYEDNNSLIPALCQLCNKSGSETKISEMSEKETQAEHTLFKPKDHDTSDIENTMDEDLINENHIKEEDYEEEATEGVRRVSVKSRLPEETPEQPEKPKERIDGVISQNLAITAKNKINVNLSCECGEKFRTLSLLHEHCELSNHILTYSCDFCSEKFSSIDNWRMHMDQKHAKMSKPGGTTWFYKCPLCNLSLGANKHLFWDHLRLSHREQSLDCKVQNCQYTCVGTQLMTVHNLTKHSTGKISKKSHHITCEICARPILLPMAITHYVKDHYIPLDDGRREVCGHCGEVFKTRRARMLHINEIHLKISYDCDQCGKSFKRSSDQLRQHKQKVHMKESLRKQCQVCGKWLQDPEVLANHIRKNHTGETPFKCVFCDVPFFSARECARHRRYNHPDSYGADQNRKRWLYENQSKDPSEFKFKCLFCHETSSTIREFSTISELRQHWSEAHPGRADIPIPPNKYLIICELCGVEMQSQTLLKIHTFEKHEVDKTECPFCQEKFMTREESLEHVKVHKYSQNYYRQKEVCPQCGYVGGPGNMKHHMRRMHEKASIRPTACTYCNKEFSKYASMVKHRKIAHREQWNKDKERIMVEEGGYSNSNDFLKEAEKRKRYVHKSACSICGRVLCSRTQLHLHMKALHGTGLPGYTPKQQAK